VYAYILSLFMLLKINIKYSIIVIFLILIITDFIDEVAVVVTFDDVLVESHIFEVVQDGYL
jgi:hypothetical protein